MKKVLLLRLASLIESRNFPPHSCCVPWTLKYIQSILKKEDYPVYFYDIKARSHSISEAINLIKNFNLGYIVIQSNSLEYTGCELLLRLIRKITNNKIILIGQHITYSNYIPEEVDYIFKALHLLIECSALIYR